MANKQLLLEAQDRFKIVQSDIPPSPLQGAVIKVHYAGLCHSDVHVATTRFHPKFVFPRILGHEVSGTIHTLGKEASEKYPELRVGDRVIVFPWGNCHNCTYCKHDDPACPNVTLPGGTGPINSYMYGVWRHGGYQNYMSVDFADFLLRVPDEIALDQAAVVPCSGITALNAVKSLESSIHKAIQYNGKALVGVVGAGGLGLWAIQLIKALHPSATVVAVDINEDKLVDARRFGADIVHKWSVSDTSKAAAGALCKACGGFLDGAIDFIGAESVIERTYMALNMGATLSLVGLGGHRLPPLLVNSLLYKNVAIKGHITGSQVHCHEVLALLRQGKIRTPPLSEIRLEDVQDTISLLKSGKQRGRAIVKL